MATKLKVIHATYFKLTTQQAFELPDNEKVMIDAGREFEVHSDAPADNKHVKVALANESLGPEGRNTWYVFGEHVEIDGCEDDNKPADQPQPETVKIEKEKKGPFKLPGYESTFYLSEPIIPNGHFSWGEATHNGTRIPVNKDVVVGIIKIATVMEEVRDYLGGHSITINSWYRDPKNNARIGGAKFSRHLSGDAVDFVVNHPDLPPPVVNRKLDGWWGSRGGLASASVFTHIDARGYRARWSYGF